MKGMTVYVYRAAGLGDCTLNGATARHDTVLLVGKGIPELFEPREGEPVLMVEDRGPVYGKRAIPVLDPGDNRDPEKHTPYMFGGNYVGSSDSRFHEACGGLLPVHDRRETWQQYRALSSD